MKIWIVRLRTLLLGGLLVIAVCGVSFLRQESEVIPTFSPWSDCYTLVIDAGHGGFDGGAIGIGGTSEQHINFSIAKRTQALAGFMGIPVKMTRTNEEALDYHEGRKIRENKIADIKMRETIVNNIQNPVFISIHLNKFQESKYWGAQVFYSNGNTTSQPLGESVQASLIEGLRKENHRKAKQAASSIYLMKKLQCPAIIVECGFLSNPEEEELLKQTDYHKRIAVCIMNGYAKQFA